MLLIPHNNPVGRRFDRWSRNLFRRSSQNPRLALIILVTQLVVLIVAWICVLPVALVREARYRRRILARARST